MNSYARLAILVGTAMAILVFVTQQATLRDEKMADLLQRSSAKTQLPTVTSRQQGAVVVAAAALFSQIAAIPAGAEAIALSQQLEAGITTQNAGQYVSALLSTDHPGVERAAHAALARTADSASITLLAQSYGQIPEERRGRVLQVLEQAQNPAAYEGLVQTVQADTSEKRSPILVSAMLGLANVGTRDAVGYLLTQMNGANEFFATQALGRVNHAEGLALMEAAAAGNKDGEALGEHGRQTLQGILAQRGR